MARSLALLAAPLMAAALLGGCTTTPAEDGAVFGGAMGTALGAIIGNQSGHAGEGALIGLGAGALTGAVVGDAVGVNRRGGYVVREQRAYHHAAPAPRRGHYETRIVETPYGETYEERVWVEHR